MASAALVAIMTVLPEPATPPQRLLLPFLIDISLFCALVNVSGLFLLLVSSLGETTLFRLLTSLCINFSGPRVNIDLSINNSFEIRSSSLFAFGVLISSKYHIIHNRHTSGTYFHVKITVHLPVSN